MPDMIKDGTGSSYLVRIDENNHMSVKAITTSSQNYYSRKNKDAYQVSTEINISTSEQTVLFMHNGSTDKHLVITYLRMMSAGADAANENAYFKTLIGGSYVSGGDAITPTNMFVRSAKEALGNFYSGSTPIVTAGFTEIDRTHQANEMVAYRKEGSIVLDTNDALTITHKGSTAAGVAYARASFYYIDKDIF